MKERLNDLLGAVFISLFNVHNDHEDDKNNSISWQTSIQLLAVWLITGLSVGENKTFKVLQKCKLNLYLEEAHFVKYLYLKTMFTRHNKFHHPKFQKYRTKPKTISLTVA